MMRRVVECVNLMVMLVLSLLVVIVDERPLLTVLTGMLLLCIAIDLSFWLRGRE